jgi:hypothetical protein
VKIIKLLHRWLGVIAAFFVLMFAISGIILNHRTLFSNVDINRKYLPKNYHYQNWNLSAARSGIFMGNDSLLVYGNIGIWLTDSNFRHFEPFDNGLKHGTDNKRTASIVITPKGNILAGTMSGLYVLKENYWVPIGLPVREQRITGITVEKENIWVLTRSHLIGLSEINRDFTTKLIDLPYPNDYKPETSLFKALWVIHSGKILGNAGKVFVDIMGAVMIILSITGIIWFVAPDMMKNLKKHPKAKKMLAKINKSSLKWHNKLGVWTLIFLVILTITGMFLRPPLLIPIVNKSFPALKHTILDHPNPWYDKLRDIQYDRLSGGIILSTSEGFYFSKTDFSDSLQRLTYQPPVSIMGINVFEQPEDGKYIIGSFSGIFNWIPSENAIHNKITGLPITPGRGMAHPFGTLPVSGYMITPGNFEYIFDYNAGVLPLQSGAPNFQMPDHVRTNSPMPLWNLALEIHTGRFYSIIFGKWYILFIPVAGLVILSILISGGILWFRRFHRNKRRAKSENCKQ